MWHQFYFLLERRQCARVGTVDTIMNSGNWRVKLTAWLEFDNLLISSLCWASEASLSCRISKETCQPNLYKIPNTAWTFKIQSYKPDVIGKYEKTRKVRFFQKSVRYRLQKFKSLFSNYSVLPHKKESLAGSLPHIDKNQFRFGNLSLLPFLILNKKIQRL